MLNRIESAKNLNTGSKIRDCSNRTGQRSYFFYFRRKKVGSAAIKQGWSANHKHTYFFWPDPNISCADRRGGGGGAGIPWKNTSYMGLYRK